MPDPRFIDALPELEDGDAALDLLQQLVVRRVLVTRRMADGLVETLAAEERRDALRTIAAAVKLAPAAPFPPACPFDILWGVSDSIVPPPDLPPRSLRLLRDVGHMPQVEAASEVVEAIREHFEGPLPQQVRRGHHLDLPPAWS